MKFTIKVIPSSSSDCIVGWLEDTLKIKVKAPADKGKVNTAVITVIEKSLLLQKVLLVSKVDLPHLKK